MAKIYLRITIDGIERTNEYFEHDAAISLIDAALSDADEGKQVMVFLHTGKKKEG